MPLRRTGNQPIGVWRKPFALRVVIGWVVVLALAVVAANALPGGAATGIQGGRSYHYDVLPDNAPTLSVEMPPAAVEDRSDRAQPPAGLGSRTTPIALVVATNSVDNVAGSEYLDDAMRSPVTRPDLGNLSAKIERQMATRGWTDDLIDEAVTNGRSFPAVYKLGGANSPATR